MENGAVPAQAAPHTTVFHPQPSSTTQFPPKVSGVSPTNSQNHRTQTLHPDPNERGETKPHALFLLKIKHNTKPLRARDEEKREEGGKEREASRTEERKGMGMVHALNSIPIHFE